MGSSCSRGESDNELPKLPVRKPSDGDVKVKRVEYLSSIRLPDETEHHVAVHEKVEEAVHETVSAVNKFNNRRSDFIDTLLILSLYRNLFPQMESVKIHVPL